MFPPKDKQKGIGIMIAVGKPKDDGDKPGSPAPLDKPKEPIHEEMPMREEQQEPEREQPQHEGGIDFGALGEEIGCDPDTAKVVMRQCMRALMRSMGDEE